MTNEEKLLLKSKDISNKIKKFNAELKTLSDNFNKEELEHLEDIYS